VASADGNDSWNNHAYSDGQPRACHGWNALLWINGSIYMTGMHGMASAGQFSSARYTFNRSAASGWVFRGLALETPHGTPSSTWNFESSPAAYDPVDNRVWVLIAKSNIGWNMYSYDASTFEVDDYNVYSQGGYATFSWATVIPEDRYLIGADRNNNAIQIVDLTNPAGGFTLRTPQGVGRYGTGTYGVYHPATKAVYAWDSDGASVYKLSLPADGDWASGTFSWSVIPAASASAVPPSVSNGPYSKFNIVNDMGNGQAALVMLPSQTQSVYVYKLPLG
jgi:hypothetical protein